MYEYPKLERDIRTDVLIMGAGISGALASYRLSRHGIDHIVVDARTVGLGSTCASTSLLQYELDTPVCDLIKLTGKAKAEQVYHCCREAIYEILDIAKKVGTKDAAQKSSLYFAARKKDIAFLTREYKARKEAGFEVSLHTAAGLKKRAGIKASAGIISRDAAQIDSYLLTHSLHQFAIRKGAQVYDRSEITGIDHHRLGVRARMANGTTIRAKQIIYACGYEVSRYISKPIVKLSSTFVLASEPISAKHPFLKEDLLYWNTAHPYLYMRTTPDRRILVGGRDLPWSKAVEDETILKRRTKLLLSDFQKTFPQIPFIPEFSWSGVFGSTKDGMPYIGTYKGKPNSYFALGYGGNGIVFSQVAANIITDAIAGKKNKLKNLFLFDRN